LLDKNYPIKKIDGYFFLFDIVQAGGGHVYNDKINSDMTGDILFTLTQKHHNHPQFIDIILSCTIPRNEK
jgi:hypothetical protein